MWISKWKHEELVSDLVDLKRLVKNLEEKKKLIVSNYNIKFEDGSTYALTADSYHLDNSACYAVQGDMIQHYTFDIRGKHIFRCKVVDVKHIAITDK